MVNQISNFESMSLLHRGSAPCTSLESRIGEEAGIMRVQVACPRPGYYPSEISSRLSAVRRGMEMIGQSIVGQNMTQGVALVLWGRYNKPRLHRWVRRRSMIAIRSRIYPSYSNQLIMKSIFSSVRTAELSYKEIH
jgi:hypothetical protein